MSQSAIKLSDEARQHFNNQVRKATRKRERWDQAGAIVALLATYGLVVYFLAETIARALL